MSVIATTYDEHALFKELERVFDICHGCRRCVSLCHAFPTLFDLVDESSTMELDGVEKNDYRKVVDHCYVCDLCFMTKCPYVPPHKWAVHFPHPMRRAKAVKHAKAATQLRDRALTSTDAVGRLAGIHVVAQAVNAANRTRVFQHLPCSKAAIAATQIALERRQHLRFHALAGDYSLLIVLHHGSRFLPDRFRRVFDMDQIFLILRPCRVSVEK